MKQEKKQEKKQEMKQDMKQEMKQEKKQDMKQEIKQEMKQEKKQEKKQEMSVLGSIAYTIQMIWKADKGCVIYTFYKNCSEMIFNAFFFIYSTQLIYTCISKKLPFSHLVKVLLIFCSLHIVIHIASAGHAYYYRLRRPKVYKFIFDKVITKASGIELCRYEQPAFYDKFSRAFDECLSKALDGLLSLSLAAGFALAAFVAIGIIATVDPLLIIFVLPPVFGSLFFGSKQNREMLELRKEETRDKRVMEYAKRVFYEKKYASEIRLYGIRNILLNKHKQGYEGRYAVNSKHRKKIFWYQIMENVVFMGMTQFGSYIYITFILKAQGNAKLGAYIAMLGAVGFVSWMIRETVRVSIEAGTQCMYMNNLKEFLEYEPVQSFTGRSRVEGTLGDIIFDHVSFTYEGGKNSVINDLSLTIKKGEKIALVGENGAGKTTLVKLLMGLYQVTEGRILAGGSDIRSYEAKEYHNHFGTVFQDLQIFALPLAENVLMRQPQTQEERELVEDALQKAQFGDKLSELPKGIDTMITKEFDDNGFVCSGGQAQKIAIARVFAKNPDVVILDEPSSALDPIAEYNMYNNMLQVSEGKTVFFISHRLSSARIADKIYFLEHGQIKESGTHDELIAGNGSYARMFNLQAQNYRDGMEVAYNG